MSVKIVIANNKGGVAKTTTANALGSIFASMDLRTLLIDGDPQADLSLSYNIDDSVTNLFEVLTSGNIKATPINESLFIIPGSDEMENFELFVQTKHPNKSKENFLKKILNVLDEKDLFDVIIIDLPPRKTSDLFVKNAWVAGTHILAPFEPHLFSIEGVRDIVQLVHDFNEEWNPELIFLGAFATMVNEQTTLHSQLIEEFRSDFPNKILQSYIAINIKLQEYTVKGSDITTYDSERLKTQKVKINKRPVINDYQGLANEIIEKIPELKELVYESER